MPNLPFEHILLRTLAEHVPHRIYAKDTECRFVFANKAVAIGMGASEPADLIGKTDFRFYPAQSAAQYFEEEQQIMRTGVSMVNHEEHVHYELSNEDAWMLTTKVPLQDDSGQVIGIAGINYDITTLKAAEKALRDEARRSEESYRSIVEGALEGIFRVSIEGRMLSANPAWARMLGYDSVDELTDTASDVRRQLYVHPEDRDKVMSVLLERGYLAGHELELYRKDGATLWVSLMSRLVRNDAGEVLFIESFASDVTERKRAEAELKRNQEHLEELVAERTAELTRAKELAEVANQAKSAFLANMSHELRTPLNAVLGFAQILGREGGLGERQLLSLNTIERSGEHLMTLIDDVLDLAKVEAGKLDLYPEPVVLNEFIQLVADIIRTQAYAKNLQFICDVATELPETVCCDAKRLRQVLLNLLGNSVKFTDHGLAGLRVRAIHRRDSQARLRIEVEDSGVGIAADKLESIFLPFEQTGDASRRSGGTGLGLAISRQLLRLMGSDIHATSQLGKGSRFWFDVDMPITASESDEVPPQISATGYLGPRKTVLIADDVYDNRVLLVALFASLGFNTIEATNGEALLGQAQSARPDLIITDVAMPKMDGVEATLQLRAMPAFETLPVIAVSANVSGADRAQCLAAGVNAFLSKPIAFGPLLQQVGELLQLQWTVAQPVSAGEPPAALVAPPQEEIEILYRLAKLGNMRSLRERADHVSALGDEFRPFADRLRELADGFQSRAIVNLISAYM